MNEQNPGSGRGSGKRGRPAVGKPEQVRLSDSEKALAQTLGNGVLAKGVREALLIAQSALSAQELATLASIKQAVLNDPNAELAQLEVKVRELLSRARRSKQKDISLTDVDLATAKELGEGDIPLGVSIALNTARFLGTETSRKMGLHGTDHNPTPR